MISLLLPQMGKSPKVIPRAAENANCVASAPLKQTTQSYT